MKFDNYSLQVAKAQSLILLAGKKRAEILSDYSRTNDFHMEQLAQYRTEATNGLQAVFSDLGAQIKADVKAAEPKPTAIDWNERSYYAGVVGQETADMTDSDLLKYFDRVNQEGQSAKRAEAVRLIGHKMEQTGSPLSAQFNTRNLRTMPADELEFHATKAATDRIEGGLPTIKAFAEAVMQGALDGSNDFTLKSVGEAFAYVTDQAEASYNSIKLMQPQQ